MPLMGTFRRGLVIAGVTAAALAAGPAAAQAACPVPNEQTKVFANWWGWDQNLYYLAPGGSFEDWTMWGWELHNGATTVTGGDEQRFSNPAKALQLKPGQKAVSPPFCVDETQPHFRFAAKADGPGELKARVQYLKDWQWVEADALSLGDFWHRTWVPSGNAILAPNLAIPVGGDRLARLVFESPTAGTTWRVDSVFVDPYRRR